MKLKQLECFCAVAETLNFTKAAQQLYITQPALSKIVASLEEEMGCTLIERSKVSPRLTKVGELVYRRAAVALKEIDDIQRVCQDYAQGRMDTVIVGTLWGGLQKNDGKLLKTYGNINPSLNFEINEYSSNDLFQAIRIGLVDIAIYIGHESDLPEDVEYIPTEAHKTCLICRADSNYADRMIIDLSELKGCNWLTLKASRGTHDESYIRSICINNGFEPNISMQVDSPFVLLDSIEQGFGVAIAGTDIIQLTRRELEAIPIRGLEDSKHFVLWKKGENRITINEFTQFVRDSIE